MREAGAGAISKPRLIFRRAVAGGKPEPRSCERRARLYGVEGSRGSNHWTISGNTTKQNSRIAKIAATQIAVCRSRHPSHTVVSTSSGVNSCEHDAHAFSGLQLGVEVEPSLDSSGESEDSDDFAFMTLDYRESGRKWEVAVLGSWFLVLRASLLVGSSWCFVLRSSLLGRRFLVRRASCFVLRWGAWWLVVGNWSIAGASSIHAERAEPEKRNRHPTAPPPSQ